MSEYITHSRAETVALGKRMAAVLAPGALIAFTGGLGAGKTAFTEGLAEGLGCTDPVSSPTFAIVNYYRGPRPLAHFDLYSIATDIPLLKVSGDSSADLLVVGWGGTYGHLYSAVEAMNAEGKPVAFAHFNYINPLPANTEEILRRYKKVVVCELNNGQFASYLSGKVPGVNFLRYNKIQAQPFMVSELMAHFSKLLEE
jgi:tRNA threonylcarbamoyl adenosine modification protein YjeE